MSVGDTGLRGAIGFGAGMEAAHPADLMCADAFRGPRHAFRAEIGAIGKHAGQHGGNILWCISRPDMGELVGESRPFMHFPQQIGYLDQRIHVGDFGIEGSAAAGTALVCGVTIRVPFSILTPSSFP